MPTMVETVTGPIRIAELGRTLMHLFIAFAGVEFDPRAGSLPGKY